MFRKTTHSFGKKTLKIFLRKFLDLLVYDLLLVVGQGDGHAGEVVIDGFEQAVDGFLGVVEDVLALLQVLQGSRQVEPLLDLLDLFLGLLKVGGNGLVVLSIAHPGVLGLLQQLQPVLGLLLGVVPADLNAHDMTLEELGLVGVLKDLLSLFNQLLDDAATRLQLDEGLLLTLNQLVHVLDAGRGNVPGGGEHDAVQELDMGLQLVAVGVALPVQVHHDLGLHDGGDELLVLLDEDVQFVELVLALVLGALGHEDLEDGGQPLLDLRPFQVLAESLKARIRYCISIILRAIIQFLKEEKNYLWLTVENIVQ